MGKGSGPSGKASSTCLLIHLPASHPAGDKKSCVRRANQTGPRTPGAYQNLSHRQLLPETKPYLITALAAAAAAVVIAAGSYFK